MFQGLAENKIKKLSYPNLICDQIIQSIKDGTLQPGEVLPSESDFVKQFGVGRTSVREALASLEYLNIIVANNGKYYINGDVPSYFKKKLLYHYKRNEDQWQNMMVVRRLLEVQFAQLAAQRATENNLIFMRQILEDIGEGIAQKQDPSCLMERFVDFHASLAAATQNSLLVRIFDRFKDIMFLDPDSCQLELQDFETLYCLAKRLTECIQERDGLTASMTMEDYLRRVEDFYTRGEKKI